MSVQCVCIIGGLQSPDASAQCGRLACTASTSDLAEGFEMQWRWGAPETRKLVQQRADIEEDLEVRKWVAGYPTHRRLVSVVDVAARRAECVARLEYALRRLR